MGNKYFSDLLRVALGRCGKQEALAADLDLSPSALSKRISGEAGWHDKEIDRLLQICGWTMTDGSDTEDKIETLKKALKIFMEE